MSQQTEHITKALLVFAPLYRGWIEMQLSAGHQGVKTRLLVMLLHTPHMQMRYYARLLGISKAHMTTLVDECTQSGLVVRTLDIHDRRASQLSLTTEGIEFAEQVWAHYVAQTAMILDGVSEAQREVFLSVCVQLTERMHAMGCGSASAVCDTAHSSEHDDEPSATS